MLLLDTAPLVDFFQGKNDRVRSLIREAEAGALTLAISVMSLCELFYIVAGIRGEDVARACVDDIQAQVSIVAVDAEIATKAGELKFRYAGQGKKGLPMADAIIAATAWYHGAEVVTADPHFSKIAEIRVRPP